MTNQELEVGRALVEVQYICSDFNVHRSEIISRFTPKYPQVGFGTSLPIPIKGIESFEDVLFEDPRGGVKAFCSAMHAGIDIRKNIPANRLKKMVAEFVKVTIDELTIDAFRRIGVRSIYRTRAHETPNLNRFFTDRILQQADLLDKTLSVPLEANDFMLTFGTKKDNVNYRIWLSPIKEDDKYTGRLKIDIDGFVLNPSSLSPLDKTIDAVYQFAREEMPALIKRFGY